MHILRHELGAECIGPDTDLASVHKVLSEGTLGIVFVIDQAGELLGAMTPGDVKRAGGPQQTDVLASQVCNRNARYLPDSMTDALIARCLTPLIKVIPLVDDAHRLTALATLQPITERVNLNIGAGSSRFQGFVNLDLPSDWYAQAHQDNPFVAYDIRQDDIPYANSSVDNIYCSHVIEHLPDEPVARFFAEASRVLKPGGVLRIACPDAEFLRRVSEFDNDYWYWRRDWFLQQPVNTALIDTTAVDFLVRELATSRVDELHGSITQEALSHDGILGQITSGLEFDPQAVGNHINYWTYEKVENLCRPLFSQVIRSKYQGCVSIDMTGDKFDATRPNMSLYVDLVK